MPPRWLRKIGPLWHMRPVNCVTGAHAVPALAVIPDPADTSQVRFGNSVTIRRADGREQTFRIVGEDEANPARGTISHVSPLAQSLMGKSVGDVAKLGASEIEIQHIR
jgi:transcription elongation GreA/GreB family factor